MVAPAFNPSQPGLPGKFQASQSYTLRLCSPKKREGGERAPGENNTVYLFWNTQVRGAQWGQRRHLFPRNWSYRWL